MSERKVRNISILLILAFVFTLEYIMQSAWIYYLKIDGNTKIEKCLKMENEKEQVECLTQYIEDRNHHAILGVNGYLITILGFLGVTAWDIYRTRKKKRLERQDARCECE